MLRGLLALAVIALAAQTRAAETCAPLERIDGPSVYVIMHGYPYSPNPALDALSMVDADLINMGQFFRALGPKRAFVHGINSFRADASFGKTRRPATWRALMASVESVVDDIDGAPKSVARPQVYLYFVGHGTVEPNDRLRLFTAPDEPRAGPGYDGNIDSHLIAEHILRPLSSRADVHLIVDACHSYHMVQTRGPYARERLTPRPPLTLAYSLDFAAQYPTVGALLAGRTKTPEVHPFGGIFSHLVRSLAIGAADLDGDGIITYREMADALPQVLPHIEQAPKPEVMPPAGERDRPFIDWRSTPAARVCLPADVKGRFRLMDALDIFATVYLPGAPRLRWLPPGRTLGLATSGVPSRYFVAADGPVDFMAESPYARPPAPPPIPEDPDAPLPETAEALEAAKTWEPLPSMMSREPTLSARAEPPMTLSLPVSLGIAAVGGATAFNVAGVDEAETWLHVDVLGRVGRGRHRLLLEANYARAALHGDGADPETGPPPILGHRWGGRLGYGQLISEGAVDLSVGALIGLYQMWGESGPPKARRIMLNDVALRGTIIVPFGTHSRWGWRLDAEVGAAVAGRPLTPTLKLATGLDFEALVHP